VEDFEALYAQYFADVYRYALSLCRNAGEAEEITQETFFKALQKIDEFHGECRVYVWLCEIAKNTWFSRAKAQKRLIPEEEMPEQPSEENPEQALHRLEEHLKSCPTCAACGIAYNVIGSYVAPDGTLVEPFGFVPLAWLFAFLSLIFGVCFAAANRRHKG